MKTWRWEDRYIVGSFLFSLWKLKLISSPCNSDKELAEAYRKRYQPIRYNESMKSYQQQRR